MESQLHHQLDAIEALRQREALTEACKALYGEAPTEAQLTQALTAPVSPPSALSEPPSAAPSTPGTRLAALKWEGRWTLGMGLVAMGGALSWALAHSHTGLEPDVWDNGITGLRTLAAVSLVGGLGLLPWRRSPMPSRSRALNWAFRLTASAAMALGGLQAALVVTAQASLPTLEQDLSTYSTLIRPALQRAFHEVDTQGTPVTTAAISNARYTADSTECTMANGILKGYVDTHSSRVGLLLREALTQGVYARGCMAPDALFAQTAALHARAEAMVSPFESLPFLNLSKVLRSPAAMPQIKASQWCTLTLEWPAGTPFATRQQACAPVPEVALTAPQTLAKMGIHP
jgi:hypothetical protein